jgi:hypothetical protein
MIGDITAMSAFSLDHLGLEVDADITLSAGSTPGSGTVSNHHLD